MRDLKVTDGFHIQPQCGPVLDRTYAYAILGIPVPCPTPVEDFIPTQVRRRFEAEWPRLRGGRSGAWGGRRGLPDLNHGWRW